MEKKIGSLLVAVAMTISPSAWAASPKITKSFNPDSIVANEFVTMSIGFINPNSQLAVFVAPFSERLPNGMVILGSASTSCGGTLRAEPGGSEITLVGAKIPAYGACHILAGITATRTGSFESKTEVSALQTDKGNNSRVIEATLTVIPSQKLPLRKSK